MLQTETTCKRNSVKWCKKAYESQIITAKVLVLRFCAAKMKIQKFALQT